MDIGILIPSGLVLIHNHVAHPFPVAVLEMLPVASFVQAWRKADLRPGGFSKPDRSQLGAASVIMLLLLLPFALDVALYRSESNCSAILRHLRHHGGETKTLWAGIGSNRSVSPGRLKISIPGTETL